MNYANKAAGPENLQPKLLKEVAGKIAEPVAVTFGTS